jgi:hypothetical protein
VVASGTVSCPLQRAAQGPGPVARVVGLLDQPIEQGRLHLHDDVAALDPPARQQIAEGVLDHDPQRAPIERLEGPRDRCG